MSDLKQSALARRLAAREAAATSASDNTIKSDLRTSVAQLQKNLESLSSYSNETKNLLNYNLDVTIPSSLAKQVVDITDVANPASIASRLGTAETTISSLTADKAPTSHTHTLTDILGYYDDKISELTYPVIRDDFIAQSNETGETGEAKWNFTNGSIQTANAEANHPGITLRRSGTTANQVASMYLGQATTTGLFRWDQFDQATFIVCGVATNADHIIRFGLFVDAGALAPVTGLYFQRTNSNAFYTPVAIRSSLPVSTVQQWTYDLNWHKFKIRKINSTNVGFTVDDGVETVLTTVLQAGDLFNIGFQVIPTTTTARDIKIDFFSLRLQPQIR